jgi:hypothetical protein
MRRRCGVTKHRRRLPAREFIPQSDIAARIFLDPDAFLIFFSRLTEAVRPKCASIKHRDGNAPEIDHLKPDAPSGKLEASARTKYNGRNDRPIHDYSPGFFPSCN